MLITPCSLYFIHPPHPLIYPLPLHDALPISMEAHVSQMRTRNYVELQLARARVHGLNAGVGHAQPLWPNDRSEEHTSELQSLRHLVCRLLLEKKNKL